MPVSDEFRLFVLDQLGRVTPVRARRMFGALGLYAGDLFFAVLDDDTLYLKADERTVPRFEAEGMKPFRPIPDAAPMSYRELPVRALEDADELAGWVADAIGAARRAKEKKPAPTRRRGAGRSRPASGRGPSGTSRRSR